MLSTSDLVFVSGVGFRSATSAMLATPISAERGQWSVTIERLVSGPTKAELTFSLTGSGGPPLDGRTFQRVEQPPWVHLPITLRYAGGAIELTNEGRRHGMSMSTGPGTHLRTIQPTVTFAPLPHGVTEVEVVFDGAPGNWVIPVTLTPSTTYGLPATSLEVSDAHHGVKLTLRGAARGDSMTAIDVYASLDPTPHPRFMRSLGLKYRGNEPSEFDLRDDTGRRVQEFAMFNDEVADGREMHKVVVFPALDQNAMACALTIDDVTLAENLGEWTTLPVPAETTIRFGTFDVRASVTKTQTRRGPAIRVFLDDGGWRDDRRLLYPETVWVNGRRGGIGWDPTTPYGEPRAVTAEDAQEDAREVQIENPVVRLHGPWRFEIPL